MWMGWQLGLQAQEMIALTWEQVDFQEGVLHLPDRSVTITSALRRILEEEHRRRDPEEDPHVLLTEQSRKPLDLPRLSRLRHSCPRTAPGPDPGQPDLSQEIPACLATSAVSLAISSPSLVLITRTLTLEVPSEILTASACSRFFSSSMVMPRKPR